MCMEIDKKLKIMKLLLEVDEPLLKFFDIESNEMLDKKIEVLLLLKNGKTISEIPNFYNILELYPDESVLWD